MARKKGKGKEKVHRVLSEFKRGSLRSSSGTKVTDRSQALAIALSEAGLSKKRGRRKAMGQKIKYTHHK